MDIGEKVGKAATEVSTIICGRKGTITSNKLKRNREGKGEKKEKEGARREMILLITVRSVGSELLIADM